jgi:hypothetical protein
LLVYPPIDKPVLIEQRTTEHDYIVAVHEFLSLTSGAMVILAKAIAPGSFGHSLSGFQAEGWPELSPEYLGSGTVRRAHRHRSSCDESNGC